MNEVNMLHVTPLVRENFFTAWKFTDVVPGLLAPAVTNISLKHVFFDL